MLPGNSWQDCHLLAERAILSALHTAGLLVNGTVDDFVNALLGPVFFPHGLGHLIGCDTHDAGAYIPGTPARATRPGLSKLRTARTLEAGMVLTNEPGCYFIDVLLTTALNDPEQSKFINVDMLEKFRTFGGVRLEDVVLVTENGPETLSTCPRTVKEIEEVMAGGSWPPAKDDCPELKRAWTRLAADGNSMEIFKL
jgi:Xaa-Pro dipeptidase